MNIYLLATMNTKSLFNSVDHQGGLEAYILNQRPEDTNCNTQYIKDLAEIAL